MGVIAVREMARHRYRQSQFAGLTRLQLDEVGRERQVQQQGRQRAEALAERSVEIAQAMVRWFPWRVRSRVGGAEGVWREGFVCVHVNVRCVWELRSCVAVLRVIVCLSSLCVRSGSRVCSVRG